MNVLATILGFLLRARRSRRGAVSVEFALILPVMVTMLTGLVELSNLMMAERRVSGTAHSVADLLAQETDVTDDDIDDIFDAASLVMEPFNSTNLTIGVASVRYDDDDGTPATDWTDSFNGGAVGSPTVTAAGLGQAGESVIIVTTTYTYQPVLSAILSGPYTLSETAVTRPRYIDYVGKF